jgi:hypothetical protein
VSENLAHRTGAAQTFRSSWRDQCNEPRQPSAAIECEGKGADGVRERGHFFKGHSNSLACRPQAGCLTAPSSAASFQQGATITSCTDPPAAMVSCSELLGSATCRKRLQALAARWIRSCQMLRYWSLAGARKDVKRKMSQYDKPQMVMAIEKTTDTHRKGIQSRKAPLARRRPKMERVMNEATK